MSAGKSQKDEFLTAEKRVQEIQNFAKIFLFWTKSVFPKKRFLPKIKVLQNFAFLFSKFCNFRMIKVLK